MKKTGLVLMVLGILGLVYGGIYYNRNHTVLEMGSMNITATDHKGIPVSTAVGAIVLIGGVVFFVAGRRRSQIL